MTVARSECGKAGEQRASLQERRFKVDHRAACHGDNGSCGVFGWCRIGQRLPRLTDRASRPSICCNHSRERKGSIFGLALKILMKRGTFLSRKRVGSIPLCKRDRSLFANEYVRDCLLDERRPGAGSLTQ